MLLLRILVALLDLGLFKEEATHHRVLVQESLNFLCFNSEQCLEQRALDAARRPNKHRLEKVKSVNHGKGL